MMLKRIVQLSLAVLIVSCSTPTRMIAVKEERVLPKKWQARAVKEFWGAQCAKPREVGLEKWTLCPGEKSAHGSLRRFNQQTQNIEELVIQSRDPLAMSVSVTAESPWIVSSDLVYVGTEDGRILGFDYQGQQKRAHEFALHAWVQHLVEVKQSLFAVVSRYNQVLLVKLNTDLSPKEEVLLPLTLQSVEMVVAHDHLYVSTDQGALLEYNFELELQRQTQLSEGKALGEMLVHEGHIFVGNEAGVLFHLDPQFQVTQVKNSTGPISSAPVYTEQGIWVAYDEEGSLRLFDFDLRMKQKIAVPFQRSLLGFRGIHYGPHVLLEVTSLGHINLLNSEGEFLLTKEENGIVKWEIEPMELATELEASRVPAGQGR